MVHSTALGLVFAESQDAIPLGSGGKTLCLPVRIKQIYHQTINKIMDRKGWLILFLCGIALMLNAYYAPKNEKKVNEQSIEKEIALEAKMESLSVSEQENEGGRKEELFTLIGKDDEGNNLVAYHFSNLGGGVKRAEFLQEKGVNTEANVTLNRFGKYPIGSLSEGVKDFDSVFFEKVEVTETSVIYRGEIEKGISVEKRWSLVEESAGQGFRLDLEIQFVNNSERSLDLGDYTLYTGSVSPIYSKERQGFGHWFYYDGDFEKDTDLKRGMFSWFQSAPKVHSEVVTGLQYAGVSNQFFAVVASPKSSSGEIWVESGEWKLHDAVKGKTRKDFRLGFGLPDETLGAGEKETVSVEFYIGPKDYNVLKSLGAGKEKVMNYGMMGLLAPLMHWILNTFAGFFEGQVWRWGMAIILLTLAIRVVIWPLYNKSNRTSKRMAMLQPELKKIREQYSDDPMKMNRESSAVMKKYGVNPVGGCLPMLLQIPIFFGVFSMLNPAVELRGQSFLWVKDLALPDTLMEIWGIPINILPFVMAGTMIVQMSMMPKTGDPLQRKIFMFMPVMFFFFCYGYASALALYWSVQNCVSIFQTWLSKKLPDPQLVEGSSDDKPKKKGLMEKFAERMQHMQEEAQRMQEAKKKGQKYTPQGYKGNASSEAVDSTKAPSKRRKTPKTGG